MSVRSHKAEKMGTVTITATAKALNVSTPHGSWSHHDSFHQTPRRISQASEVQPSKPHREKNSTELGEECTCPNNSTKGLRSSEPGTRTPAFATHA